MNNKNQIVVAVSGGFDPVHIGHIRMFKEAKALGDKLVVIMNNDNWLKTKKGYCVMYEKQRAEILESIRYVDEVVITNHKVDDPDRSVCEALRELNPDIFANGGDRFADNIPEFKLCKGLDIELVFNVGGGKLNSSSKIYEDWRNNEKSNH